MHAPTPPADAVFEQLLAERYSCRGYLPEPVPREIISRMFALAQRTPSWCNSQPWQAHVLSGPRMARFRAALVEHATRHADQITPDIPFPERYSGIHQTRRRECGFQLYDAVGVARGDRAASMAQALRNFAFFDAPHVAIITSGRELGSYGAADCVAYVNNLMLAARSLGVASIAQAALAGHAGFIREHLGIADDRLLICGVSFGYEDAAHPANQFRTHRAAQDEVVTWLDA